MRKLLSIMALFVISLLTISMVSALDSTNLRWGTVKINGDEIDMGVGGSVLAVEEGETLHVRVGLVAATGAQNVEVEARISGYEYSDRQTLEDSTPVFDIAPGTTKYVTLDVELPRQLDSDQYLLRLRVLDRNTEALTEEIVLAVESPRHGLDIADVSFSPGNTVKAGRSLLTTVLLENYGDREENDVKVTVSVPQLGVSAVEYVDVEFDTDDIEYEDVPEMFLSIPANAAAGDYDVEVTAEFNQYDVVTKTYSVHVLANELFQSQDGEDTLVLAVGPESQNVAAGSTATYAVALNNPGARSTAYVLAANTGSWATTSLSESLVVLEAGKTKVVYVQVTAAENAPAGQYPVSMTVSANNEVLQTVTLSANVVGAQPQAGQQTISLRNGLEIALIVLVVLLVIIGLIIGFSRLRKDGEEEEKTYY